jgi:signal transduction histidine kinase
MIGRMFNNLKIRWKILLSSYLVMLLTVIFITSFIVAGMKREAAREIEMIRQEEVAKKNGGAGYVDYLRPKPTKDGLTTEQPKLSYVREFKPLKWIVGTGVYIDSIDEAVAKKSAAVDAQIRKLVSKVLLITLIISLLTLAGLWFIASKISAPLVKCADFAVESVNAFKTDDGEE